MTYDPHRFFLLRRCLTRPFLSFVGDCSGAPNVFIYGRYSNTGGATNSLLVANGNFNLMPGGSVTSTTQLRTTASSVVNIYTNYAGSFYSYVKTFVARVDLLVLAAFKQLSVCLLPPCHLSVVLLAVRFKFRPAVSYRSGTEDSVR